MCHHSQRVTGAPLLNGLTYRASAVYSSLAWLVSQMAVIGCSVNLTWPIGSHIWGTHSLKYCFHSASMLDYVHLCSLLFPSVPIWWQRILLTPLQIPAYFIHSWHSLYIAFIHYLDLLTRHQDLMVTDLVRFSRKSPNLIFHFGFYFLHLDLFIFILRQKWVFSKMQRRSCRV